jgi:RimJ/RimL family protein N-acetyltransferase
MIPTQRLTLRKYITDDWARVHVYAKVPELSQYEVWGPNSAEDTKIYVASCIAKTSMTPILEHQLAVILNDGNVLIGGCGLKRSDASESTASLGYAINPEFQNRGFATETATALIDFGFNNLGLTKVEAECDTRNTASCKVMEKAGMKRVAQLPDDREVKGQMSDSYRYEILRESGV